MCRLKKPDVPINEKVLLSLSEASALTGICYDKLIEISNVEECKFVMFNGNKRMFKREKLIEYLLQETQI